MYATSQLAFFKAVSVKSAAHAIVLPERRLQTLKEERNPVPHNGIARELFASDLLAVRHRRLSHPHEETEKMLLRIGERLGLRGPEIDKLHQAAIAAEREKIVEEALSELKSMTLTVIDGDFPRKVECDRSTFVIDHANFFDQEPAGTAGQQRRDRCKAGEGTACHRRES